MDTLRHIVNYIYNFIPLYPICQDKILIITPETFKHLGDFLVPYANYISHLTLKKEVYNVR